jgi:hypothetical protein
VAPPYATVLVNAPEVPAPPLPAPVSAILKADEGILTPLAVPVRAAALLAKYAYTPTAVRPGCSTHLVVAVMFVLPTFAALPALNVKLTALAERLSVSDSERVAFKAMGCAPEFNACADAIEAAKVIAKATAATRTNVPVLIDPPKMDASGCWPHLSSAKAQSVIRKFMTCGDYSANVGRRKRYPSNRLLSQLETVPVWEQGRGLRISPMSW